MLASMKIYLQKRFKHELGGGRGGHAPVLDPPLIHPPITWSNRSIDRSFVIDIQIHDRVTIFREMQSLRNMLLNSQIPWTYI